MARASDLGFYRRFCALSLSPPSAHRRRGSPALGLRRRQTLRSVRTLRCTLRSVSHAYRSHVPEDYRPQCRAVHSGADGMHVRSRHVPMRRVPRHETADLHRRRFQGRRLPGVQVYPYGAVAAGFAWFRHQQLSRHPMVPESELVSGDDRWGHLHTSQHTGCRRWTWLRY